MPDLPRNRMQIPPCGPCAGPLKSSTQGTHVEHFAALRRSKLVVGLSVFFWLFVAVVLVVASLVHARYLQAALFATLCLVSLGYALYGTRFTHLAWRARSIPHHALWFVTAALAVASAALAFARLLVDLST